MGTGAEERRRGADKPHFMEKPIPSHLLGNWWMLLVSSQVGQRQQLYRLLPLLTGLRIRGSDCTENTAQNLSRWGFEKFDSWVRM